MPKTNNKDVKNYSTHIGIRINQDKKQEEKKKQDKQKKDGKDRKKKIY